LQHKKHDGTYAFIQISINEILNGLSGISLSYPLGSAIILKPFSDSIILKEFIIEDL
jgi:hypothetical protein